MDSFSFNLQAEKANAILKHRKLQRIASFFRVIEVCVVLILISRLSLKLPVAVRNSSEYLREFSLFMNSPRFVFLIGNVIIITLFAQCSGKNVPETEENHELVILHNNNITKHEEEEEDQKHRIKTECVKINPEEQKMKSGGGNNNGTEVKKKGYVYRRCETEILKKRRRVLRRCESENKRKSIEIESAPPPPVVVEEEVGCPEDEMSSEEFRRTVEAFIARQQRVRKEEDYYLL